MTSQTKSLSAVKTAQWYNDNWEKPLHSSRANPATARPAVLLYSPFQLHRSFQGE